MATIYGIVGDLKALERLVNEMTDPETGETRAFTDEELQMLTTWADEGEEALKNKIDGICKVYKNKKAEAGVAEAERDALKAEIDRLKRTANAKGNEADRIKNLIGFAFDRLGLKKLKTNLFNVYPQKIRKTAKPMEGFFDAAKIPEEFLRPRELSPSAIDDAVKRGRLYEKAGGLDLGKLFYRDEGGFERALAGVSYLGGETLVIR